MFFVTGAKAYKPVSFLFLGLIYDLYFITFSLWLANTPPFLLFHPTPAPPPPLTSTDKDKHTDEECGLIWNFVSHVFLACELTGIAS